MDMTLYRQIGQRIRRAREAAQLSQEELARLLDFSSPATISNYESGERRISVSDLQRIGSILGLPVSHLLGEEPAPEAQFVQLRAKEVRPGARDAIAAFVTFARKHGSASVNLPAGLQGKQPPDAASGILQYCQIDRAPISPWQIAEQLHIPVYSWDLPDEVSGIFVTIDGLSCIAVNDTHPNVRQRFTVAHEIGHAVYSDARELFVDFYGVDANAGYGNIAHERLERKANQFAAELLMPSSWLREEAFRQRVDLSFLARRYDVSEQAMWFRLLNLGLISDEQGRHRA